MTAPSSRSKQSKETILVRGVNWLGDAIMTMPALTRLREARPDAEIVLLTPAKLVDLWLNHPALDSAIAIEGHASIWEVARLLRKRKFQTGVIFPNSPRSALELFLAGIPRRIGYAARWRRWLLTTAAPARADAVPMRKRSLADIQSKIQGGGVVADNRLPGSAHHVFHYLALVALLGASANPVAPVLRIGDEEIKSLVNRFPQLVNSDRPLFGMNPGAEYGPAKRWPVESFVAAGVEIQRRTNCRWLICGGKNDTALANQIIEGLGGALRKSDSNANAINLAGATTLRELCVALKLCRVLLTNDTGPMHVAAAVGTPVVVPFGSTSPELTGPGTPGDSQHRLLRAQVPCSPCFLRECPIDFRCMYGITVESVVAAVLSALREK